VEGDVDGLLDRDENAHGQGVLQEVVALERLGGRRSTVESTLHVLLERCQLSKDQLGIGHASAPGLAHQIDLAPHGAGQASLQRKLFREGRRRLPDKDGDVDITGAAQHAACPGAKQQSKT
jgi:hypothetical protein